MNNRDYMQDVLGLKTNGQTEDSMSFYADKKKSKKSDKKRKKQAKKQAKKMEKKLRKKIEKRVFKAIRKELAKSGIYALLPLIYQNEALLHAGKKSLPSSMLDLTDYCTLLKEDDDD